MATQAQMDANQRNAARSTGPKTDEGKAQSRGNAIKHGMTSRTVLPADVEATQEQRYVDWLPSFTIADPQQEFHLRQIVAASLQIEQCQSNERLRRIELAVIASDSGPQWDRDRQVEAARMGKTLKRDPQLVALQLRLTPAGRAWLISQFQTLLIGVPETGKATWTLAESNHLLDLLGKSRMLRTALLEVDHSYTDPTLAREWIVGAIAGLEAEQVHADVKNAKLRLEHVEGYVIDGDAQLKLIRRYEVAAQRRFDKFTTAIRKANKASKATPHAEPECETKPIPVAPVASPTVAEPKATLPGNRRYRRKLEKDARHEAHLAKRSA